MALAVDLDSLRQSCPNGLCVLFQGDDGTESFWAGSIAVKVHDAERRIYEKSKIRICYFSDFLVFCLPHKGG